MSSVIWYCLPLAPFLTRALLFLQFRSEMIEVLKPEEQDRETHRSYILVMAGFSFSGLLAMAVLYTTLRQDFHFSVYYLLLSFLFYLSALNLQAYKESRWQDQLATALMDSASLCLILSVVSILNFQNFSPYFAFSLTMLAILVWCIDHFLRIKFQLNYLKTKRSIRNEK